MFLYKQHETALQFNNLIMPCYNVDILDAQVKLKQMQDKESFIK